MGCSMPVPPAFFSSLSEIFPRSRCLVNPGELAAFESDGLTAYRARPAAVVMPDTREEIVRAVRACGEYGIPFVARGSGTSLSGGSVPIPGGIVIALNRMNRILRLDAAERLAVVEPGVVNASLSKAAAPHGLLYAPDPSSQPVCTIGGNVAFNSGGAHCLKYGMTSNHVLGMTVVLPDATTVELGGASLESAGPDLAGGFVGSEGLWGIAVEITLRLLPVPEVYRTILAAYDNVDAAGTTVGRIVASGLLPGAMEIMDRLALEAVEAAVHPGYPAGAEALLIVELEGERGGVDADFERLGGIIRESGAREVRVARDGAERLLFWKGRKSAFSAVGRLSPDYIVQDGVVPRSRLGEALAEIRRLARERGIRVANVFHAGDGNLHPLILYDGREPGALGKAEELAGDILRLCLRLGGSITGEHGVGLEKIAYLPEMFGAADLAVMRRLRAEMDPRGLSNRGKMFTGGQAPALASHGAHPLERAGIICRE
jgi:glycolate oxidase